MRVAFVDVEKGRYVGSLEHNLEDIVKGSRVRLTHYNYEVLEDGQDAQVVLGVAYVNVGDEDSNRYPGLKEKSEWSAPQKKKRKKSS